MTNVVRGTLKDCVLHIAETFNIPSDQLLEYANIAPLADRLPDRLYPEATGTPSERRILYAIARIAYPTNAVECGVNWGVSTIQIAIALRDNDYGKLTAIDISDHIEGNRPVGALIPEHLRSWVDIKSNTDAIEYTKTLRDIDYLFEDTAHTYTSTYGIYSSVLPNLSHGAWCISHDANNYPDVLKAQQDLGLNPIAYLPDGTNYGLSIWRNL